MIQRIKRYWYIFAIIIVIFIIGSRQYLVASKKSAVTPKERTYTVKRDTLKESLTLTGKIDAYEKATLNFQTSGRLAWVGVNTGDAVKKYQAIASLDQRDVKKKLDKYLNTYLKNRWTFEQSKDDNESTVDIGITREIRDRAKRLIDETQFDLNNSVLDVELQDLALQYSTLVTPIEGVVTRVDTPSAGVNINALTQSFEIVNPKSIYLSVLADQTEVTKLTTGMSGEIVFDAYPDLTQHGTITSISFSPKLGETSTVYEAKIKLPIDNSDFKYRIDMTADATFVTKEKPDVLAVPLTSIKEESGKKYVQKKVGGKKEKVEITTGEETDTVAEVTSGLAPGDVIYD